MILAILLDFSPQEELVHHWGVINKGNRLLVSLRLFMDGIMAFWTILRHFGRFHGILSDLTLFLTRIEKMRRGECGEKTCSCRGVRGWEGAHLRRFVVQKPCGVAEP